MDDRVRQFLNAVSKVHEDAESHGYGEGHHGIGSIDCPVCHTGKLQYSVASVNGHIHGRCTTDKCVRFME